MERPSLKALLPTLVIVPLLALAGCAAAPRPAPRTRAPDDLPPATRMVHGLTVAVVGDHRPAVQRLVDEWRDALDRRDVARLRALFAPRLGAIQQPGPGMSREAWLVHAEAIFASAARARASLQAPPVMAAYGECAPRCASALLAPGEWLIRWPGAVAGRLRPGLPSDRVLPSTLRVAVTDAVAVVVGVDDDIAAALGPATVRFSGSPRP